MKIIESLSIELLRKYYDSQSKPGECISEVELGNQLNVSRTPVREAIVRLSEEKLIDVFPQKGSFVSKIDLNLVDEAVF